MHRRFCLSTLVALMLAVPVAAKPLAVETTKSTFKSAGKEVRVEMYLPEGRSKCPAIVLVHDSAGMGFIPGTVFRQCSQSFAQEGYAVALVHYFDSTGHSGFTADEVRKADKHWPTWKNAIRSAVKLTAKHPRVDSERIGLLGFSLGAYLSLAVASEKDMKINAVVELFGGLPEAFWKEPQKLHLCPTCIIHGTKDQIVPAKEAYALHGLFSARKIPCELKFYDCGHLFKGTQLKWRKGGVPGNLFDIEGDIADARHCAVRFFGRHLKGPSAAKKE